MATTAGISGEMIRDMMVRCVERRFSDIRAPHPVQWLSDNGPIFTAHRTIEIAAKLRITAAAQRSEPAAAPETRGFDTRVIATALSASTVHSTLAGLKASFVRLAASA